MAVDLPRLGRTRIHVRVIRVLVLIFIFACLSCVANAQSYGCNADTPCSNGACCGPTGVCGYGPSYCGIGCQSNCKATAECGQYAAPGSQQCPLKVCCSQWGFCGTTEEFCGTGCQSNCGQPSQPGASNGDVRNFIIGYYEGWRSDDSLCGTMQPSQIPADGLDVVNFAFAYIDPKSYDVVPMPGISTSLIKQVTDIKSRNPGIKVWVSIGGWDFSDNGTSTQPIFPKMAASSLSTLVFAQNLVKFMIEYGFDGVDLDWEYPGAPDRGGAGTADLQNFPKMLADIRSILDSSSGRGYGPFGLSITAPTSYWYLRWYDVKALAPHVDFFNLMTYDLHGVWDETDPFGSHVYAHTNISEINDALNLFWRNSVSPDKINLGLAFYGRSFRLQDPSCAAPGCEFSGPGRGGGCTDMEGILTWREIEAIRSKGGVEEKYDADAAVNYMVWDTDNLVSYDNKNTFQQKIDLANRHGLHGLFIWAIDQDDDGLSALRAVTGKDLIPAPKESTTQSQFRGSDCTITKCGESCAAGWTKMTGLNLDRNGVSCPNAGKNNAQRSLCCPAWGAPDPRTCSWYGTAPVCYGQCQPGQMELAEDNYGAAKRCNSGRKAFCCPATGSELAIAACKTVKKKECPSDLPQRLGSIGRSSSFCCPAKPVFNNCKWHGASTSCNDNRCPLDQIELTRSADGTNGDKDWGCDLYRQKALCCDPPEGTSAILPVPLANLFPETFSGDQEAAYYESFESTEIQYPSFTPMGSPDPNQQPFAWTIMVGPPEDVVSLRRRDGSDLELFDCPNPSADDYSEQTFHAVCMAQTGAINSTSSRSNNNCEEVTRGGTEGTILRLPDHCGPDEWVRAVSFRRLNQDESRPAMPHRLVKRANITNEEPAVYEIRYDYNLRKLRRADSEVYVRFDSSFHAGYWDEIVKSAPKDPLKRREAQDWRSFHLDWFERHGYTKRSRDGNANENRANEERTKERRGYAPAGGSGNDDWWLARFKKLLSGDGLRYGVTKSYSYTQTLYSARRSCPGTVDAHADVSISGTFKTTFDYGISLVGALHNFNFEQAYSYFNMHNADLDARVNLDVYAGIQIQSQPMSLLQNFDPFGAGFNIKGLWIVGPYFKVDAQLQNISAGMSLSTGQFQWMYPPSLNNAPTQNDVHPFPLTPIVTPGIAASSGAQGSLTVTTTPELGFQIRLDAFGSQLVDTQIRTTMESSVSLRVGASASTSQNQNQDGCSSGVFYGVDASVAVDIGLQNPLPGWKGSNYTVMPRQDVTLIPMNCFQWGSSRFQQLSSQKSTSPQLSSSQSSSSHSLVRRANFDTPLFPDPDGNLIACPLDFSTPTNDCHPKLFDEDANELNTQTNSKRAPVTPVSLSARSVLEPRDKNSFSICKPPPKDKTTTDVSFSVAGLAFDSASQLLSRYPGVATYGPLHPLDCTDYSFGLVATPTTLIANTFATEHILEWQLVQAFLVGLSSSATFQYRTFDNPLAPNSPLHSAWSRGDSLTFCQYLNVWWDGNDFVVDGRAMRPFDIVMQQIPGANEFSNELVLLDVNANGIKSRLWDDNQIRKDTSMSSIDDAIAACRGTMDAVNYMQTPQVLELFVRQATRVANKLDEMETNLANIRANNIYQRSYEKLNLGSEWKKFLKTRFDIARRKQRDFLDIWVARIVQNNLPRPRPKKGGNNGGGGGSSSGNPGVGGQQTNPEYIARINKLQEAYDNFIRTDWADPLPDW